MKTITTFAPDANPLSEGVLVEADGIYPIDAGGVRAVPSGTVFTNALAAECKGAWTFRDLSSSFRTFAGTATKLYQLAIDSWTDVSLSGDYVTPGRWRFAPWGNYVLAANNQKKIQVQTASAAAFAEISEAPVAKYITASQNFVIAANISGAGNRVQWSAYGDYDEWTPALSTQAGFYDLTETGGDITGMARLGNDVLIFKQAHLFHGSYIGAPYVWSFRRIISPSGAVSNESIVETESGVFFMGVDDLYHYDGNVVQRIGTPVRRYLLDRIDGNNLPNVQSLFDSGRHMIFWFYPTKENGTGATVEALIYDYKSGRWGRVVRTIEAGLLQWSSSVTYDTISTFFASYDAINVYYDSPWWTANVFSLAYVDTDHKMNRLNGTPGSASFTTGDQGDLSSYSRILKAWPYFSVEPTTCTIAPRTKVKLSDTATEYTAMSLKSDGSVDLDKTGKFISLEFNLTGDFEIAGFDTQINKVAVN